MAGSAKANFDKTWNNEILPALERITTIQAMQEALNSAIVTKESIPVRRLTLDGGQVELQSWLSKIDVKVRPKSKFLDAINGDPSLFVGREEIEESWRWCDQIIAACEQGDVGVSAYQAGSWGPSKSELLIDRDGRSWNV